MRLSVLSRVLFPAPLRPMTPTTSPRPTSKETSRSAQNVSHSTRRNGCRSLSISASAAVVCRTLLCAIGYALPRPRREIAVPPEALAFGPSAMPSDNIGEPPLHPLEGIDPEQEGEETEDR